MKIRRRKSGENRPGRPGTKRSPIRKRTGIGLRKAGRRARKIPVELGKRFDTPGTRKLSGGVKSTLLRIWCFAWFLVFSIAALIEIRLNRAVAWFGPKLVGAVSAGERQLTPIRLATVVVIAATAALAVSQFTDYRGIGIGQPQYDEVAAITAAPLAETETPWSTHGPLVVLLGLIAAAGALASFHGGGLLARRARLVALVAGAACLAAILFIDLPQAGEVGVIAEQYADTEAVLLKGFYAELSAAVVLLFAALLPAVWKLRLQPRAVGKRAPITSPRKAS